MVILTDEKGNEVRALKFTKIDVDLNETRDFELVIPASEWAQDLAYGCRVFIPDTEYGGVIGGRKTSTAENTVTLTGYCWRGFLYRKIIEPPTGQAYKTMSGELNSIIADLITEAGISSLFSVSTVNTGISVTNYQFDRYITLLDGIYKMLKTKGYRLGVEYIQQEQGSPGYVQLSAVPVEDYSQSLELSQDQRLNFTFSETKNGVNHLICLGKGEGTDRVVVDLFIQQDGSIGSTQYYKGMDEIAEVYDNTSAEDEAALTERGTERLQEVTSMQTFTMDVESLNIDVDIGDIIGGRDYITGMSMAKPIVNKIYTEENGKIIKEYRLEGDEQ